MELLWGGSVCDLFVHTLLVLLFFYGVSGILAHQPGCSWGLVVLDKK